MIGARNPNRIVFPSDPVDNRPSTVRSSNIDYFEAAYDTNITNVRQFLGAFGLDYNQIEEPVLARSRSADIPMQANCHVESRTIDLDTEVSSSQIGGRDAETLLFPRCVRVNRCAGCCDLAGRTTCTATKKSSKQIRRAAIRLKRSSSGAVPEASTQTVSIEVHEECRCMCRVQPEDCSELQEYQAKECRCVCRNSESELRCHNNPDKMWDSNECACKCKNSRHCSTGLRFSHDSCSCVPN